MNDRNPGCPGTRTVPQRCVLTLALATALSNGWAQQPDGATDATDEARGEIEEVVVTGQKIERSLQDTAASVAVFDAEIINSQNFITLSDILNQTANVATSFDDAVITIRGVRNTGAAPGDQTSDVSAVYVDGVFLPSALFTSGALNLWDIESAEIFRGPQSTIQGRNALAGAVVLNTVDPGDVFTGSAQLLWADYNTIRGSAAVTLPLVEEEFALRLAVDRTSTDGFIENRTFMIDDGDRSEGETFRGKALWTPTSVPDLRVTLAYTHIDSFEGDGRIQGDLFPPERVTFENVQSRIDNEADIVSLQVDHPLGERWNFTSVSAYTDSSEGFLADATRDASGGDDQVETFTDDQIFSQEFRATFEGARARGLLGAYYFNQESAVQNASTTTVGTDFAFPDPVTFASLLFMTPEPTPLQIGQATFLRQQIVTLVPSFPVLFDRANDLEINNYALFGEMDYDLTDRWRLTVGLRYDREDIAQNIFDSTFVPPIISGDPQIDQILAGVAAQFTNVVEINDVDNEFDAWLPKAALSYQWNEDVSTSLSYQRGYRAGGLSVNVFRSALAPGNATQQDLEALGVVNSFDPEFTDNYELAFRSQWLDNRLSLNANVFWIDYTDQQINVQLSSNVLDNLTENVGASELYGFEVDLSALLADGFQVGAYAGYSRTEFTDGRGLLNEAVGGGIDLTGNEFSYAPRWTAGGFARYEWESGWFVNGRVRYQDESFSQFTNDPLAVNDSFTLVDLIAGYQSEFWRAELFLDNATDEEYLTVNFGPVTPGGVNIAGDPRLFGGRVFVQF